MPLRLPGLGRARRWPPCRWPSDGQQPRRYRDPRTCAGRPAVSVLIPARNEAANIGQAVPPHPGESGRGARTAWCSTTAPPTPPAPFSPASTTRACASPTGAGLPPGWSGKQHACAALAAAGAARPAGVRRCRRAAGARRAEPHGRLHAAPPDVALASGFPRQITRSWSERLLLPLIHFLLLGYLPLRVRCNARPPQASAPAAASSSSRAPTPTARRRPRRDPRLAA